MVGTRVPRCLTAAKTRPRAVVPVPGRSAKDLPSPDLGLTLRLMPNLGTF